MLTNTGSIGTTEPHIRQLDGLRGLAILLVAAGHIFYKFYVFKFGWIGLNLFFLLSGYLITNRLFVHAASTRKDYFRNFYARRILRIFPLYYGCLIFLFGILPLFYNHYQEYFGSLRHIQFWYWLYISNWRIIFFGLPPNPVFFHFWSLAVEEQFYLFWPVLFILVRPFNRRLICISILLSISIGIRIWEYGSQFAYYNTLTAGEPLLLGCLISLFEKKGRIKIWFRYNRILAAISMISLSIIFIHDPDLHITNRPLLLIGYSNINVLWAYLLVSLLLKSDLASLYEKIFNSGYFVWLGKYSYGIYVFHWIVLQLFVYKYESALFRSGYSEIFSYWLVRIAGISITLLLSYLSYQFYEMKFLALKKYFT